MKKIHSNVVLSIRVAASIVLAGDSHADSVQLNSGKTVDCRVLRASPTTLFIHIGTEPAVEAANTELAITDIKRIELGKSYFDSNGKLHPSLNQAALAVIWSELHPVITRPGNKVPLIGIHLCMMILESNEPSVATHALNILEFIKMNASDPSAKIQAADAKIYALERLRWYPQARSAAAEFEGEGNPLLLQLRANLTIGICGHEDMRLFLNENPRWQQDPRVHKEHQHIYERTLDAYVFTSLFGGGSEHLSGRALYQAALFHLLCNEKPEAERIYKSLSTRFQTSTYTKQLKDELNLVVQAR